MATVLFQLRKWGLILAAVLLTLLGAYAAGGRASRRALKVEQAEDENKRLRAVVQAQADTTRELRDVNEHVSNLPSGDAESELRRDWMRDRD